jgi:hypothetical protein
MAFWTQGVNKGTLEPKRNFRFKVSINSFEDGGMVWWAKSVTKPSYEITESEHTFLTHKFYYPGRLSWQEVEMTLVDPISPGAVGGLNKLVRKQGYVIPELGAGADVVDPMLETMSKGKGSSGMGTVQIIQLDSNGNELETWELSNAWIKGVKYGDLAYDNDDLTEITLTLRYDYASCEIAGDDTDATNNKKSFALGDYSGGNQPTTPSAE